MHVDGHTNWAKWDMTPEDLLGNPHEFDYENGIKISFKNSYLV